MAVRLTLINDSINYDWLNLSQESFKKERDDRDKTLQKYLKSCFKHCDGHSAVFIPKIVSKDW